MRQPKNTENIPIQGFCTKGDGEVLAMDGTSKRSNAIPNRVLAVMLIAVGSDITVKFGDETVTVLPSNPLKVLNGETKSGLIVPIVNRYIAAIGSSGSLNIVYSTDE